MKFLNIFLLFWVAVLSLFSNRGYSTTVTVQGGYKLLVYIAKPYFHKYW
jgi:hypothetical protein